MIAFGLTIFILLALLPLGMGLMYRREADRLEGLYRSGNLEEAREVMRCMSVGGFLTAYQRLGLDVFAEIDGEYEEFDLPPDEDLDEDLEKFVDDKLEEWLREGL